MLGAFKPEHMGVSSSCYTPDSYVQLTFRQDIVQNLAMSDCKLLSCS